MHGYPGADGLAADGAHVVSARRTTNGYLAGVGLLGPEPTVSLATGTTASASVEGLLAPTPSQSACPTYTTLLITPPNETHSVRLATGSLCDLEIHPVVPGSTGRGPNT
ncbi:MAG: hypothetical protein QOF30_1975 [Acidimicrobiaceae bacterium]|nr:hypothetical protein [Acidimicrobiaceae bacterium]